MRTRLYSPTGLNTGFHCIDCRHDCCSISRRVLACPLELEAATRLCELLGYFVRPFFPSGVDVFEWEEHSLYTCHIVVCCVVVRAFGSYGLRVEMIIHELMS